MHDFYVVWRNTTVLIVYGRTDSWLQITLMLASGGHDCARLRNTHLRNPWLQLMVMATAGSRHVEPRGDTTATIGDGDLNLWIASGPLQVDY